MISSEPRNYRETLLLPKTGFSMKANLPQKEQRLLDDWKDLDLHGRLRQQSRGQPLYILHDGPPYANGALHIGTALNKILKDIVVRSRQMSGYDANYVPGWDCHGLPIEWEVEARYRRDGVDKDTISGTAFRKQCREFAEYWIDVQKADFKRLGVIGNWDHPYTTMTPAAEATIIAELHKFLMDGTLYLGSKPVFWSSVERTALAEAEIEYRDHTSTAIAVKFPLLDAPADLKDAKIVIWTTTPWTIPGNRAIAFSPSISYGIYQCETKIPGLLQNGEKLIIADSRAEALIDTATARLRRCGDAPPLAGLQCEHPLRGQGYDFNVPLYDAPFVTDKEGSGLVHIAPGHGHDDFAFGMRHNLELPDTIDESSAFMPHIPLFAGCRVLADDGSKGNADQSVIDALKAVNALVSVSPYPHSYPHSWRSRAPLLLRKTPQWFVSMSKNGLRKTALNAVEQTHWVPESGRNRMKGMITDRPDWVLSRQRRWGVPIAIFVHRKTQQLLRDDDVNARICHHVHRDGIDSWFESDPAIFLGPDYDPNEWQQVNDILDVWFESGCSHAFVLEARKELSSPASLYLEGSDQHRGWFQSSLLESCATRGRAPYQTVLTHGFVLAADGRKMSKSLGNVISPNDIISQYGADVLRLWCASVDYWEDVRIGPAILTATTDTYRKIRNTLRFMLGNLSTSADAANINDFRDFPDLERWVLHRLVELDRIVTDGFENFNLKYVMTHLHSFMTHDLSAFYFDIRKDRLYCDPPTAQERRATITVLAHLFDYLVKWLAPILCFTAEEAWRARYGNDAESIHLHRFTPVPALWHDDPLAKRMNQLRTLRRVVTGALEQARRTGQIGSTLEAAPEAFIDNQDILDAIASFDLAEMMITSDFTYHAAAPPENAFRLNEVASIAVTIHRAKGVKCPRSWKIIPETTSDPDYPDLSPRDADAVRSFDAAKTP